MTTSKFDIGIIGGGIAGLATAIRLKKAGYSVCLLEKNNQLGGKLAEYSWNGFRWDKGPSLFTMPHLVQELLDENDDFAFSAMEENCRYFFANNPRFSLMDTVENRKQVTEQIFNPELAEFIEKYLVEANRVYERIGKKFIDYPKSSWRSFIRKDLIPIYPDLMSSLVRKSLNQRNQKLLKDQQLVQLFNRFGTYNGSNPYEMSGLYQMISSLELVRGTYFPNHGMRSIVEVLEKKVHALGVEVKLNSTELHVEVEENGYLVTSQNDRIYTNQLVCAIDHLTFYRDVLKDKAMFNKYVRQERSSSGLVFYWAVNKKFDEIGLHNIFFSNDYKKEFDAIFKDKKVPLEPTIYIHNSSCANTSDAPEGMQNWFVMINTPSGIELGSNEREQIKNYIIDALKKDHGISVREHIIHENYWSMIGIESETGAFQGALYGPSSNHKLAALKRHGNKVAKYKKLYFCGGTVHPGGGIPLVLKSAKIVEKLVSNDRA